MQQRDHVDRACGRPTGRHMTTAGVCILLTCCVLFTQIASTQALSPHTIDAIGKKHAIENWNIETTLSNATRYGLKRMAQGHQQYCLQAATGFAKDNCFLTLALVLR